MPKFKFNAKVTVSTFTEVEADTYAEALAEAQARDAVIGGNGTGNDPEESWIVDDIDGVPFDIEQE